VAAHHRWRWWTFAGVGILILAVAAFVTEEEMRTSRLQSMLATTEAQKMRFTVAPGPSDRVSFPVGGPYDQRLGYKDLPNFIRLLGSQDYAILRQARQSPELAGFIGAQGYGLYEEKEHAGLTLSDRNGDPLYFASYPEGSYDNFQAVPELVTKTLLFVEDRNLLDARYPQYNPAVEWKRFLLACVGEIFGRLDRHLRAGGASTLATQIEKFRHSPQGRTEGPLQKLKQMTAATLRAYLNGRDTSAARRQLLATYLDSTPLGSRPGYGEIIGVGDGLRVWYGTDFQEANRILSSGSADIREKGLVYKQMLSLLLAERRPAFYLGQDHGRLLQLTNRYLRALSTQGVIDASLRDAALADNLVFRAQAPAPAPVSFIDRKATDAIRTVLLRRLQVANLYALDHLDMSAETTIDTAAERRATDFLARLADPDQVKALALEGKNLLGGGNPADVNYSVVLYERGNGANYIRVHADSLDEPFDINSGAKLQLGSTAKLRTLIEYLQIVERLHAKLANSPADALEHVSQSAQDPLTQWAADYLAHTDDRRLQPMLDAAMQRKYSAGPGEAFFTGGGMHVFHNFEKSENYEKPTVAVAIARSINLAFIRIMRDIERYYIAQEQLEVRAIQADARARQIYLKRFADQEGKAFLVKFYKELRPLSPDERLKRLAQRTGPYAKRLVIVYRSVHPKASIQEVSAFLKSELGRHYRLDRPLPEIYEKYGANKLSLEDRGYLTRVHPLELWLTAWLEQHPNASRRDAINASAATRQEVYGWLMKSHSRFKQDVRIRILVEQDAFKKIWQDWHALGYPFAHLVPSLATAIGSSGDRPDALADLIGILVNNGMRQPTIDLRRIQFASHTPYETDMAAAPARPQRVLAPEIANTVRGALMDVMVEGTGKHYVNAYTKPDGEPLDVGGKTGTGDNRFDVFAGAYRLIESRVVDRTSTFVFFLGDRHFGTITAYVPGSKAAQFHFTSALAVQLLERLTPALEPLLKKDWQSAGVH
jgi:membrane peptidoglycan carboxypeptidase